MKTNQFIISLSFLHISHTLLFQSRSSFKSAQTSISIRLLNSKTNSYCHHSELTVIGEDKKWNLKGIKEEVNRNYLRTFKKISKLNEKIAQSTNSVPEVPMEVEDEKLSLQLRLESLKRLEEQLKTIKSATDIQVKHVIDEVIRLDISDSPPPKQERGPKKVKASPPVPRKPFIPYQSLENIEIRVGRGASDNDELSCNPKYRDSDHWWMHVAGYAGSHVVLVTSISEEELLSSKKETVLDAATLAAHNSKANQSGRVAVSLTRCRNVSKPKGAKPGLVTLRGEVVTVSVDVSKEFPRLERLKSQVIRSTLSP